MTDSLQGLHAFFVHMPAKNVERVWKLGGRGLKPRWHKVILHGEKADWLPEMPLFSNWVVRNVDISEQALTTENAVALGREHAESHARCQANYIAAGVAANRLLFEGRNEPQPPEFPYVVAYEVSRLQRAIELGVYGLLLLNWGVGQPGTFYARPDTAVDWKTHEPVHAAMRKTQDKLGLHEYFGVGGPWEKWPDGKMRWGDEGGRHLQCPWMDVKILINEAGLDNGVNQEPKMGWQHLQADSNEQRAQMYLGMVAWADRQYLADPRIDGVTLFTHDWENKEWWMFGTQEDPFWSLYQNYITAGVAFSLVGDTRTARWWPLIENQAAAHGLDPHVVATVVAIESNGRVDAISPAGATGLMQVMPLEAGIAGRPERAVLLQPERNLATGCAILESYSKKFLGDLAWALGAYNMGPAGVLAAGIDSPAAKTYLGRFTTAWAQLWPDRPYPVKVTGVTPPPVDIENEIRNAAWLALYPMGGIPLNPDAAFQRQARARVMGVPTTKEIDVAGYRFQGFANVIVYCIVGDWGNMKTLKW